MPENQFFGQTRFPIEIFGFNVRGIDLCETRLGLKKEMIGNIGAKTPDKLGQTFDSNENSVTAWQASGKMGIVNF